jgi:hypothetical protein
MTISSEKAREMQRRSVAARLAKGSQPRLVRLANGRRPRGLLEHLMWLDEQAVSAGFEEASGILRAIIRKQRIDALLQDVTHRR